MSAEPLVNFSLYWINRAAGLDIRPDSGSVHGLQVESGSRLLPLRVSSLTEQPSGTCAVKCAEPHLAICLASCTADSNEPWSLSPSVYAEYRSPALPVPANRV